MVKKYGILFVLGLILMLAPSALARTWTYYSTQTPVGFFPSLDLINGSQPVVSGYAGSAYQLTPLGWVSRPDVNGYYFAGDGGTTLVSNNAPIKYGKDGRFYSTIPISPYYGGFIGTTLENGAFVANGVVSPYQGGGSIGVCSADTSGRIYVAYGNMMGVSSGAGGVIGDGLGGTIDMAVSDFGDVAVSTIKNGKNSVSWFDHVAGTWGTRDLGTISGQYGKVAVEFDSKGNLGVAYCNGYDLRFAYYDFQQNSWQDEYLRTLNPAYGLGTALAFNKNDLPVIAAGNYLAYDPISVPEPISIFFLSLGVLGVRFRRFISL